MITAAQSEYLRNDIGLSDADFQKLPHVLLVVDQLPLALGGGERIALKLAALLPEYGYRASILTFAIHSKCAVLRSAPCPIYLLPLQRTYDVAAFRAALDLKAFLKEHQVKVVQTFFESSDLWAGGVTKAMSTAKLIWSRRDMGILRARKHSMAYRIMRNVPDAVFTVSEQVRRHSMEVDGIDPDRIQTIYNGINISNWNGIQRAARTFGEVVITTVGNIRRVKGHDIFIKAAASLAPQFPKVRFNIAGEVLEPEYFSELQDLIMDLHLSKQFSFIGGVTNLREHLTNSDIFVLPSRSEGFSNAIIEAMAAALPVIATNVGGNSEAVTDGVTGILVSPEDPVALSSALLYLISDPDKAKAMGEAGKELVTQKFTVEVMMRRTVDGYNKILSDR